MCQTGWSKRSPITQTVTIGENGPRETTSYVTLLRYVKQRALHFFSQALHVTPLDLEERLARQSAVEDHQLGLVKQPLHHKHGAWERT